MRIDICIATFRRRELLAELLESLAVQQYTDSIEARAIVIDNDAGGSAREIVAACGSRNLPVTYAIEPVQSIAMARARGLSLATAELIALIDDDERAEPTWLQELVNAQRAHDADVVFGPVVPALPEHAPAWIRRGGFFERARRPTGATVPFGASGNVLMRRAFLERFGVSFDPAFGAAGSDTEFFARLHRLGALQIWCDSAVAHETVTAGRLTVGWLVRRALIRGHTFARIFPPAGAPLPRARWFARRAALALAAAAGVVPAWIVRREWGVRLLQKLAANLGQLSAALGSRPGRAASV